MADYKEYKELFQKALEQKDVEALQSLKDIDGKKFSSVIISTYDINDIIFLWENKFVKDDIINKNSHFLSPQILQSILEKGFNPNQTFNGDMTLIHKIVWGDSKNEEENIKILLGYGADINAQDKDGNTALHILEDEKLIEFLLENGANPEILNYKGKSSIDNIKNRIKIFTERENSQLVEKYEKILALMEKNVKKRRKLFDESTNDLLIKDLRKMVLDFS